ncbi:ATP-binding protein [Sphingomonas azotifigens]|uniref:ATP-binding protein n=1 Tax=Sphingomonas azotifigens TaxID=330920 RepID=UPI000A06D14B|nr:ATP-binding protein [Sphingomonas azotifigens]
MTKRISLARQLGVAMAALATMATIVSTAAFYLVYGVLERLRVVAPLPPGVEDTTGLDIGITLAACVAGVGISLAVAVRVARRIVRPLGAVGDAARRIAEGDLATRIDPSPDAHGETSRLIADFNAMADRLQRMSENVQVWNAQIAHELRTPLTVLRGRLQGAQDGVFALDAQLVAGLLVQVEGLTRLVEDLRSVSLADSGRLEVELADIDLAAELAALAPTLSAMLAPAGFGLELDLQPGIVRADRIRIRQAVIALTDNAVRHADRCTVRITTAFAGDMAVLTVADEGPGLAAGLEVDAFRQFVRGPGPSRGSGLGLAVVQAIARAHGGEARYLRTEDRSMFRILLPRREPVAATSG